MGARAELVAGAAEAVGRDRFGTETETMGPSETTHPSAGFLEVATREPKPKACRGGRQCGHNIAVARETRAALSKASERT